MRCSAPLFLDALRQLRRCERSRILDIDCQMLRWLRRRGHQAYPLTRVEAVPRPLRHDDDHSGAHRVGFRTIVRHGVECCRAVDDLHELVAVGMAFPRSVAGKFRAEDIAVAKRGQRREGSTRLSLDLGHLRSAPAQQRQFVELGLEIQNRDHFALHDLLSTDHPWLVDMRLSSTPSSLQHDQCESQDSRPDEIDYRPPSCGSSQSRNPSASMLKPRTAVTMARPGKITTHGAWSMKPRPSESMRPSDGVGGRTPTPRKDSAASTRIAMAMSTEACTSTGVTQFGRM